MNLNDFHYHLPDELIASWPAPERTASRLLAVKPDGGLDDLQFEDISTLVSSGDLLVLNDTRVIKRAYVEPNLPAALSKYLWSACCLRPGRSPM